MILSLNLFYSPRRIISVLKSLISCCSSQISVIFWILPWDNIFLCRKRTQLMLSRTTVGVLAELGSEAPPRPRLVWTDFAGQLPLGLLKKASALLKNACGVKVSHLVVPDEWNSFFLQTFSSLAVGYQGREEPEHSAHNSLTRSEDCC